MDLAIALVGCGYLADPRSLRPCCIDHKHFWQVPLQCLAAKPAPRASIGTPVAHHLDPDSLRHGPVKTLFRGGMIQNIWHTESASMAPTTTSPATSASSPAFHPRPGHARLAARPAAGLRDCSDTLSPKYYDTLSPSGGEHNYPYRVAPRSHYVKPPGCFHGH